jgi:hypothetical protein
MFSVFVLQFFEAEKLGHAQSNLGDLRRRGMKMFINQRVITYAAIGLRDVENVSRTHGDAQSIAESGAQREELTARSSGS